MLFFVALIISMDSTWFPFRSMCLFNITVSFNMKICIKSIFVNKLQKCLTNSRNGNVIEGGCWHFSLSIIQSKFRNVHCLMTNTLTTRKFNVTVDNIFSAVNKILVQNHTLCRTYNKNRKKNALKHRNQIKTRYTQHNTHGQIERNCERKKNLV